MPFTDTLDNIGKVRIARHVYEDLLQAKGMFPDKDGNICGQQWSLDHARPVFLPVSGSDLFGPGEQVFWISTFHGVKIGMNDLKWYYFRSNDIFLTFRL